MDVERSRLLLALICDTTQHLDRFREGTGHLQLSLRCVQYFLWHNH